LLSKTNKEVAFSSIIILFSMAGIPPFSGFYAKLAIFLATISATFYLYSALIILVSVISTFYYLRLIKTAFFEIVSKPIICRSLLFEKALILSFSCFLILFIFSNPNFLWLFTYSMALCLLG
jgi:NADH-quinone oxidoreductase subunit N